MISKRTLTIVLAVVLAVAGVCPAEDLAESLLRSETLTDNWFGYGEKLEDDGISLGLSLTYIYQINLEGGLSTRRREGRHAGSYDLEFEFDLEKLLNLSGGSVYLAAKGSWSEGLDESSIGSVFGVNADAGDDRALDVTQLYYEQSMLDDTLTFRIGKLDLGGGFECRGCPVSFDCNSFANDETSQFLNGALVNNPTIPMPANGLGAILHVTPVEWWYVSAGVADAQADAKETGFNTAFHNQDYFFSIYETGVAPQIPSANGPLQGTYRVGMWYDPQPKAQPNGGMKRDDTGYYLSFDQMAAKENSDDDDSQGLGLFARYGWADSDVNSIKYFWSAGAQYQGIIPTRDDDVLGLGVAQGGLVQSAGFTKEHETATEVYYNIQVTPWLNVSPSLQHIANPGGLRNVDDAVVAGLRMQVSF